MPQTVLRDWPGRSRLPLREKVRNWSFAVQKTFFDLKASILFEFKPGGVRDRGRFIKIPSFRSTKISCRIPDVFLIYTRHYP